MFCSTRSLENCTCFVQELLLQRYWIQCMRLHNEIPCSKPRFLHRRLWLEDPHRLVLRNWFDFMLKCCRGKSLFWKSYFLCMLAILLRVVPMNFQVSKWHSRNPGSGRVRTFYRYRIDIGWQSQMVQVLRSNSISRDRGSLVGLHI